MAIQYNQKSEIVPGLHPYPDGFYFVDPQSASPNKLFVDGNCWATKIPYYWRFELDKMSKTLPRSATQHDRVGGIILVVLLAIGLGACKDELADEAVVVTEEVLFVSGDMVRLSGRLVSSFNQPVDDHGFLISINESFANPATISLGPMSKPGRFIGETSGLITGQSYIWKPYAIIKGEKLEGEVEGFSTLVPKISSFTPTIALPAQIMTISGRNFPSNVKVFFGDSEAEVLEVDRGSNIEVRIPPIEGSAFVTIRAVYDGGEDQAPQTFEYITGKWEQIGNFITPHSYTGNISFLLEETFYFGLGDENFAPNPNIWALDVPSWSWAPTLYAGPLIRNGFSATGFFGGGFVPFVGPNDAFFKVDGDNFIQVSSPPFQLSQCVALQISGDLFVLGGRTLGHTDNTDIFRYLVADDRWEVVGQSAFPIEARFPSFVHQGLMYFVMPDRTIYRVDPGNFVFEPISIFPSASVENGNGITQVIGDKAYIGLFDGDRSMWEYNIPGNSWTPKVGFSGGSSFDKTAMSFAHNGLIYVFKNPSSSSGMSIWSFNPDEFK